MHSYHPCRRCEIGYSHRNTSRTSTIELHFPGLFTSNLRERPQFVCAWL